MNRRTLIKVHGFIAVFFLPLAMLYAITGALYITGSKGSIDETTLKVGLRSGWAQSIDVARSFANEHLLDAGFPAASNSAGEFVLGDGKYLWRALTHSVTLVRLDDATAEIRVEKNSLYKQLVEIHKNHAGPWFAFLGIAFGVAMMTLILSGAWMMFESSLYRRAASSLLIVGTTVSLAAYLASTVG